MSNKIIYNKGDLLGEAVYIKDAPSNTPKRKALFKCNCGNFFEADIYKVKTRETRSCGCLFKKVISEVNGVHGLRHHPIYAIWTQIKLRCKNSRNQAFVNYGGRGIYICDEWDKDFLSFYNWCLKNGWQKGLTIERENNDGPYSPNNCKVADRVVQANNRRTNKFIEYNGMNKTISEWARYFDISPKSLYQRLSRGWTFEKSISK